MPMICSSVNRARFIICPQSAQTLIDDGGKFPWQVSVGAKTAYTAPGSSWENGYCESFNARMRNEPLNGEVLYTLN